MSTYRQISIPLGTILLWLSTSVSSFAATNTITPVKFQSDTVKLSVENIPSRQLNLTPDTHLIAGQIRDMLSRIPQIYYTFKDFDDIWKNPTDRQKRLFDYCNTQKNFPVDRCLSLLNAWAGDQFEGDNYDDFDELENLIDEIIKIQRG